MKILRSVVLVLFVSPLYAQLPFELPCPIGSSPLLAPTFNPSTNKYRAYICSDALGTVSILPTTVPGAPNTVITTLGNATQTQMDPAFAPQLGVVTVLNNPGSNNAITTTSPGGYAQANWSLSLNPSSNNSVVGIQTIGEVQQTSGSYGNSGIGPMGAQLDAISEPSVGATITIVKGAQAQVESIGGGNTTTMEGFDVRTPIISGGGSVSGTVAYHSTIQTGGLVNYAFESDGDYTGTNDFAIFVNSLVARTQVARIYTSSNCSSSTSPAVCANAAAGSVSVPTGTNPTLQVNTTAVSANSQLLFSPDESLGTKLGVTCNTTLTSLAVTPVVTTRSAGVSFTVQISGIISTNPVCLNYFIVN